MCDTDTTATHILYILWDWITIMHQKMLLKQSKYKSLKKRKKPLEQRHLNNLELVKKQKWVMKETDDAKSWCSLRFGSKKEKKKDLWKAETLRSKDKQIILRLSAN